MIPSHVLVVGSPKSGKLRVSQLFTAADLKDHAEQDLDASHSGLILPFQLDTPYYKVDGKLLIDEYPENRKEVSECENSDADSATSQAQDEREKVALRALQKWREEFVSEEMKELRECLEGFVFCIDVERDSIEHIESCLEEVEKIRSVMDESGDDEDEAATGAWAGFTCVVGTDDSIDVEDLCISLGLEYINLKGSGENEFKDKLGKDRLREIFETHEWKQVERKSASTSSRRVQEYEARKTENISKYGMTKPLIGGEDDDNDEEVLGDEKINIDLILSKLHIAKEELEGMDQAEKEKHAKKIIDEVMDYI